MDLNAINSKVENKTVDLAQEAPKSEMRAMTVEELESIFGGVVSHKSPARIRQLMGL